MFDVIIVDASTACLIVATNTAHRGLKSLVIEKQCIAGGLPTLFYPDKIIKDHPGFPIGVLGKELSRMLFMQAKNAGAEFKFDEETLKIQRSENNFIEVNTDHDSYQGKPVILCTGIYNVPKKLEVLNGYKDPNIHYKLENPKAFKRKRCVIVGGGDHAFDTAVQLDGIAEKITLLVKRGYTKAKIKTVELAEKSGSEILYNTEIIRLLGRKTGRFKRIQVSNSLTGEKRVLEANELFLA